MTSLKFCLFLMHFPSHSFASGLACCLHYWGDPQLVIVHDTTLRPHREDTRRCIAAHWCRGRTYIPPIIHSGAIFGRISCLYKSKKLPHSCSLPSSSYNPSPPSLQFQLVGAFRYPALLSFKPLFRSHIYYSITLSDLFTPLFIRHGSSR